MPSRIVLAGSLAQKPRCGGHTWVLLQYLLGLRELGWDVLFLDRLEAGMCRDSSGRSVAPRRSLNLRYFLDVMNRFELDGQYSLTLETSAGREAVGLSRRDALTRTRDADLLINVMGYLDDEEFLAAAKRRVFLDIDPGFGQMWKAHDWADVFAGHDDFVTIGLNIGREDCTIPDCGLQWVTTSQPIVLSLWPPRPPTAAPYTSIGTWRGAYAPIEYEGETYGLRAHEFRKFVELPERTGGSFELALAIDESEASDLALLAANDWRLVDPGAVAADPWSYQTYIARSAAEFMVAKGIYVQSNSGWFSDRSICYLASGRPVIAQDTGLAEHYPLGEGLLTFRSLDDACTAVDEIAADPRRHARAAREVAEACFDSNRVLGTLLDTLGARTS